MKNGTEIGDIMIYIRLCRFFLVVCGSIVIWKVIYMLTGAVMDTSDWTTLFTNLIAVTTNILVLLIVSKDERE